MGLFFTALPVFFLALTTFMRLFGFFALPDPWTLEHWRRVLSDSIFLRSLGNTLVLGAATAVLAVLWYPAIAYVTVRTRYKGRHVLDFLSWLPVAIPGIILGLGFLWFFLGTPVFRPFYGTMVVLILATTITSMTLGVQLLKSNLLQLGDELEEASWVAGASWLHTFRRVILPIQAPVLVTVGTVAFIAAVRNVAGVALLVTSQNRPLAMLQLDYMVDGRYEAAAVVGMIVMLLTSGVALVARGLGHRTGIRA
jgi:iron(III) transport system permease protein